MPKIKNSRHVAQRMAAKTTLTVGAFAYAMSGNAIALGLGQPSIQSYLAQPLRVRLPLRLDPQDADPATYEARLLPAPAYQALNLHPPAFQLDDVRLRLSGNQTQGYWLDISSTQIIREPILSMLLEVRSPRTGIIRHVDLLFDPQPQTTSTPELARTSAMESVSTSTLRTVATTPQRLQSLPIMSYLSGQTPVVHMLGTKNPPTQDGITHLYGPVRPGESLSRIAQRARLHPDTPLSQFMQAIYEHNQEHFNGSPDALKVGSILAIPDVPSKNTHAAPPQPQPAQSSQPIAPLGSGTLDVLVQPSQEPVLPQQVPTQTSDRIRAKGPQLALDFHLSSTTPSRGQTMAPAVPAVSQNSIDRHGDNLPAEAATATVSKQRSDISLWLNWPLLIGLILALVLSVPLAFAWRKRLQRRTQISNTPLPTAATENGDASASNEPRGDGSRTQSSTLPTSIPDLTTQLHLRLTSLLAREPSDSVRQEARKALDHLEIAETDVARAIIEELEQRIENTEPKVSDGKIIAFKLRS